VGPSEGKIRGAPVSRAAKDIKPIDMQPLTKAKNPSTIVELYRFSRAGS
jgi:hypothetical protein